MLRMADRTKLDLVACEGRVEHTVITHVKLSACRGGRYSLRARLRNEARRAELCFALCTLGMPAWQGNRREVRM